MLTNETRCLKRHLEKAEQSPDADGLAKSLLECMTPNSKSKTLKPVASTPRHSNSLLSKDLKMDYDMINNMKVEELKYYLRLRGLKISGKKAVLVARVFSAMEKNVMPIKTAEVSQVREN